MTTLVLGDTHGRSFWKLLANIEQFDRMIFIGDYFDSFDIPGKDQLNNFLDICKFKEDNPDKVVLLVGNHDFHYMPVAVMVGEYYSGKQDSFGPTITHALELNKNLLQMCYMMDDIIFTHAGVTNTWMERCDYEGENVAQFINDQLTYKPSRFFFTGPDRYGDNVTQSPIWVRPGSLLKDHFGEYKQVVGHTGHRNIRIERDQFYFIDTLGSSLEYLKIVDGVISVEKIQL
jgi:hypothetical protein